MVTEESDIELGLLNKVAHASFCMRCLCGLPASMAEADSSRVAVGFYCLGTLDILGMLDKKLNEKDREAWKAWIWAQQVSERTAEVAGAGHEGTVPGISVMPSSFKNSEERIHVGGFRPGPFMRIDGDPEAQPMNAVDMDPPHLIMTYTALLALAILRDDFSQLNRSGLIGLLRATQSEDGSFSAIPGQGEADIRMVYTAFAISAMLDDWSGVDVPRALAFVRGCASYEGGFGQAPGNEATGGPTYCALATLALTPAAHRGEAQLSRVERRRAERWLVLQQRERYVAFTGENVDEEEGDDEEEEEGGGFSGRTGKEPDACYSFWCGAALRILHTELDLDTHSHSRSRSTDPTERTQVQINSEQPLLDLDFVSRPPHARFLARCQFRLGGLAKAPGAHPDPYHTYLALAALALYPPYPSSTSSPSVSSSPESAAAPLTQAEKERKSWSLPRLDPLINATVETAAWARARISGRG